MRSSTALTVRRPPVHCLNPEVRAVPRAQEKTP